MNIRLYQATAAIVAATSLASAQGPEGFFEVESRVMAPSCLNDNPWLWGLTLSRDGTQIFHGGPIGPDIWTATLDEDLGLFTNCRRLTDISSGFWDIPGSLSTDGTELWFESTRMWGGEFRASIFVASRDPDTGEFLPPQHMAEFDALGSVFRPRISRNGYELIFGHGWGSGPYDLSIAWRHDLEEPFTVEQSRPLREINSPFDEFAATLASDGMTLLWTGWQTNSHDGGQPFAASSVWTATRPEPFDPERHDEPPPFGNVRKLRADPPGTHFYDIAISDDWPADGARVYFVSCLPAQCAPQGLVMDVYSATWHSEPPPVRFRRGHCNDDGKVDISDAVCILNWLFLGGTTPGCVAATNTNGENGTDISDGVYLLSYLFGGGAAPVAPFSECGPGNLPTDETTCESPPKRCQQ